MSLLPFSTVLTVGLAAVGAVILVKTCSELGRRAGVEEGRAAGYTQASRERNAEQTIVYQRGKLAGVMQVLNLTELPGPDMHGHRIN